MPEMNAVDPIGDAALLSKLDTSNMGPAIILGVLHILYWSSVLYGHFKDRKERLKWRADIKAERKKQRLAIKIAAQKKMAARKALTDGNPLNSLSKGDESKEGKSNEGKSSKW